MVEKSARRKRKIVKTQSVATLHRSKLIFCSCPALTTSLTLTHTYVHLHIYSLTHTHPLASIFFIQYTAFSVKYLNTHTLIYLQRKFQLFVFCLPQSKRFVLHATCFTVTMSLLRSRFGFGQRQVEAQTTAYPCVYICHIINVQVHIKFFSRSLWHCNLCINRMHMLLL